MKTKFKNGSKVKVKKTKLVGYIVRFYEKSNKYVVKHSIGGKLYTYEPKEIKLVKLNWFKKLFGYGV